MSRQTSLQLILCLTAISVLAILAIRPASRHELPNRLPEAAPYDTAEARAFPPPYESTWERLNAGRCATCHARIFAEWNGSMMSNSWRDPAWRGAFLLIARQTATDGDCDLPDPPDGTAKARLNPFAVGRCTSRYDIGTGKVSLSRPGSLLDGFCPRCHMPTNYTDNVPLHAVEVDPSGREHAVLSAAFDPTSDAGTGVAYATDEARFRNTETGKAGLFCAVCHTMGETRDAPFHNFPRAGDDKAPDDTPQALAPPAPDAANLGYAVGAGSYRFSPRVLGRAEVLGPLAADLSAEAGDSYLSEVYDRAIPIERGDFKEHQGYRHVKFQRAEMCGACHDVTNPLTLKNRLGRWVGGFPIERTYAEWAKSRYADRPGNQSFDPSYKRDCQSCHMQQDFGQPGTAQTLYQDGSPLPPLRGAVSDGGPPREVYASHHFIGGNAYVPALIGTDVDEMGRVEPYPKLSVYSYTSADKHSVYNNAYWTDTSARGAPSQHARLAWERLRNALELTLEGPPLVEPGSRAELAISVRNSGTGHKFPTGFPEGRVGWVAVRAFDLASGRELEIADRHWQRRSLGVGYLTDHPLVDPSFPGCDWQLPAGSPDPYAFQMKAVASLGDGCPTLDLVYAAPLNMVVNGDGLPIDERGEVIGRRHPGGLPVFRDLDGDGDRFDDSFLFDQRLLPLPHPGATAVLDRYAVVVPGDVIGPVAVTAAVYYQSLEAIVAKKFLGNLADLDTDFKLEPCVLKGPCDDRRPRGEPAVVEGAPPVPMEVANWLIRLPQSPVLAPRLTVSPAGGAMAVARDVVVKATFSVPVTGVDRQSFTLADAKGRPVPAAVDQIGDGTWGLFPKHVWLEPGASYTVSLARSICGLDGACLETAHRSSFRVAADGESAATTDTSSAIGFPANVATVRSPPPTVIAADRDGGSVVVTFSKSVMNVTVRNFALLAAAACDDPPSQSDAVRGRLRSDEDGRRWTFTPSAPLESARGYCLRLGDGIYDLDGESLAATDLVLGGEPGR